MAAGADAIAHASLLVLVLLTVILAAPLTSAQVNCEIQVYGSDLVDPAHTMVELHSNFTIDGSKCEGQCCRRGLQPMDDQWNGLPDERRGNASLVSLEPRKALSNSYA